MKKFVAVIVFVFSLALLAPAQTPDDVNAVFSAWGARQAGQTVKWVHGQTGIWRLFCMWWCLPDVPAPASIADWDWGRTLAVTEVPADAPRFPGQPASCQFVGFTRSTVGGGTVIGGRCADRTTFLPEVAPGKWRAYLASLTPPASARIVP